MIKMIKLIKLLAAIAPLLLMGAIVSSAPPPAVGPDIVEPPDEDAGSFPGTAETVGNGPIASISGSLGGVNLGPGAGDFQDAWVICISDPANWSATLVTNEGGFAIGFDPRLFLFRLDDLGLLGNDDTNIIPGPAPVSGIVPESTLLNASNDGGDPVVIEAAGNYVLIVTTNDFTPQSGGMDMFVFDDPTEISSPDGPGGGGGIEEWPEAPGACCLLKGQCIDATPSECGSMEGFFIPGSCGKISCPTIGACCLEKSCEITDFDTCQQLSGSFFEFDSCDVCFDEPGPLPPRHDERRFGSDNGLGGPAPGGPGNYRIILTGSCFSTDVPTGACCLPAGACFEVPELLCVDAGGDYQGDDSSCLDLICPGGETSVACCLDFGQCLEVPPLLCLALNGLPQAPGTGCGTFDCPASTTGACCFDGGLCAVVPRTVCLDMDGLPQGIGTDCDGNPCGNMPGACCFGDGGCAVLPATVCLANDGLPQGAGTLCGPGVCGPANEACCLESGDCFMLPVATCLTIGGEPQGPGTACNAVACPPPPPLACCDDSDNDLLSLTFEYTGETCAASNHAQGGDADCDDFGPLTDPAYIIAADDDDLDDADIWFEGWVAVGDTFTALAAAGGDDDLDEDTVILVLAAPNGPLLQQIELVTDCDETLDTGHQFGSVRVVGCVPD